MTDEKPLEVDVEISDKRWSSRLILALLLVVLAVAGGVGIAVYVLYDADQERDRTTAEVEAATAALRQACRLQNGFRHEVNTQAKAFIHHNTGTLTYFQTILPQVRGQPKALTDAIRRVIRVYKSVQGEYRLLPMVNCARLSQRELGKPVPIKGSNSGGLGP